MPFKTNEQTKKQIFVYKVSHALKVLQVLQSVP